MILNFLRWVRLPAFSARGARYRLRSARPALLQLEDRTVPAPITWTGTTGANWNVAANWDLNRVPAAGDDVVINNGTTPNFNTTVEINTLSVAAGSGLSESGGTLTIDAASTVDGSFTFTFGTLTGAGNVTINGLLTWHDGTMSGAGTTIANGGIAYAVTGFPTLQGSRHLDNNGTATWTGASGSIIFSGGGTFNNNGTFDVQNDRSMGANGGGSPAFNNVGTFKKSAGSGDTHLTVPFNNSGTVDLQTGTVSFGSGGSGAGAWSVAAPATLEFSGATTTLTAGAAISGAGTMRVTQGTVNLAGVYSVATTVLQGGHTIYDGPASTTTLTMGVGNGAPTLEGSGDVTVSGLLTWDSGTMTGAGTTLANGGLVLNPEQSNGLAIGGRRVDNNGATTWTGNSFLFSGGGVFNNNGTFDAQTDQTLGAIGGGSPVFNNAGTFRKSAGAGTTAISIPFNNSGRVEVQTGTLSLTGGGTSTGDWDIAATGSLTFGGGTYLLDNGTDITGAGTIDVKGNCTLQAGDAATDVVNVSSVRIGPVFDAGTVTANGTLHVTGTMDLGPGLGTGNLNGSGDVTVGGLLTLFHGTMSGPGRTFANGGMSFQINGGGFNLMDGRRLDNNAAAAWISTTGQPLIFKNGAVFNNNATFDIQVDSQIANANAPGDQPIAINNTGTIKKTAGTGSATDIRIPFNNNGGTVAVQAGELILRGGGTSTGPWTVAASTNLTFFDGVWNLNAGSKLSGDGTVNFNGGTANLNDTYFVANTAFILSGTANFNATSSTTTLTKLTGTLGGVGDLTVNGVLSWFGGDIVGAGTIFANEMTINIAGNATFSGRTIDLATNHTATWASTSQPFSFANGAVFNNHGTFDAQNDARFDNGGGAASQFINNGTFKKSAGTGTTTINIPFANPGTVEVQTGTLSLTGGLTSFSSGTGTLTEGTYDITGTFQFLGAAVQTNSAAIILDGPKSAFLNSVNSANALDAFASNTAAGSFTIQNGRTFTTSVPFANAGAVTVNATGGSSAFTATGDYTQSAGMTSLVGGGTLTSTTNAVAIQGGALRGVGTVTGNVSSSGVVSPGLSPGALAITGDYTQNAAGVLNIELGGTTAGTQFDQLQVSGAANLNGTLNVALVNGFVPAVGNSFAVITFASRTGDFATRTGFALGNARFLAERFDPAALNLDVNQAVLRYQVQPGDTLAGQAFPVVVEVTDGVGNVLTFDNADQVTLTLNQNTFAGGAAFVTQPVTNGVASFNLTIDQAATGYQLTAGGNGFAGVVSNTFTIQQPASFTSGTSTAFTVGMLGTFTLTTAGVPTATLSEDAGDTLPGGVSFMNDGDGTATLAGIPAAGSGGTYTLHSTAHTGPAPTRPRPSR